MKIFLIISFLILCCLHNQAQQFAVVDLQCEHKTEPLAINSLQPVFSWKLQSAKRGLLQTAYRIIVSDNAKLLKKNIGNTWDSQLKNSDNSTQVFYAGQQLKPATTYYWKVQVSNNKMEKGWSSVSSFTTGLLSGTDWGGAKWIGFEEMPDSMRTIPGVANSDTKKKLGPDKLKDRVTVPLFRKDFTATKKIRSARIYITGLGQYELNINGNKIGNSFLSPGWTHYDARVLYNVYDVTKNIKRGDNALGVIVGNGFYYINRERYIKLAIAYGYPKIICKLVLNYSDGSTSEIISDSSWQTAASPITFTSLYGGEDYDAMQERNGWNMPGYRDAGWKAAIHVKAPKGKLEAEMDNPVQVKEAFNVVNISQPKDSMYMYDFGQNLSGIIELKVRGKKGQQVRIWPGELLHANGLINQDATGKPYYYTYTLKGDGIETWRPKFTYTGFRYTQVEGAVPDSVITSDDVARIVSLTSLHTRNSSASNGEFYCSNDLFNKVNELISWAIKSNLQSVVTDCPHREKLSWLEQDYLMGNSINATYDVYHLYKKLVNDMMDAQTSEGLVPDIAPEFVYFDDHGFGFRDSPEWGSASVIVPWLLYKWYGDSAVLREAYPMMKKYVAYLEGKSKNHILNYGLGDWFDYGPAKPGVAQLTPVALTASAIYFYDVKLLARIAENLNNAEDAKLYSGNAEKIMQAFRDSFYNANTKVFSTGSQTAMAMPLVVGLVPGKDRADVIKNMVDSIVASGYKLTAGDVGFHFLIEALQENGQSEIIYKMNYRDDVPGYGYQLKKGATALTESWPALESVSNNHLMLGHIMQWFYEGLGGIKQEDSSIGYKHIVIKPEVVGDIDFAKANHQTLYGNIATAWRKESEVFILEVTIPENTLATIHLPANINSKILEAGLPLQNRKEMNYIGIEEDRAVIKVGSGKYHFTVE